ncbi:MAG: hypothetical protein COB59_08595 [Rhodospirillaceae bacterium]|nr:MAG: hypothetical protein COB59_08595 [Rhodospirillaceae bacterium]
MTLSNQDLMSKKQVFDFLLDIFDEFLNDNDHTENGDGDVRSPLKLWFKFEDKDVDFFIKRDGMFSSRYGAVDEIYFFSSTDEHEAGCVFVGRYQNGLDQKNRPKFEYSRTYKGGTQTDVESMLHSLKIAHDMHILERHYV